MSHPRLVECSIKGLVDIFDDYETKLTENERAYILASPTTLETEIPFTRDWNYSLAIARQSEHMAIPYIRKDLQDRGNKLIHNSDCYGMLMRLAAFEIRNEKVKNWECFALLFFKIFGKDIVPWLPSLFLGAVVLEQVQHPAFSLEEIYYFRENSPA